MTDRIRKNRKDAHKNIRISANDENAKKYTISNILSKLQEERELYAMISASYLAEGDLWIKYFSTRPNIEFYLADYDHGDFMQNILKRHQSYIENILHPKKRRGRSLISKDHFRAKRISVYVADDELEKLEHSAKQENMSIPAFLREIGLKRKLPTKPSKSDSQAYSQLSRAASNLNQIAKHLNSNPEAVHELDSIKFALSDFRRSLIGVGREASDEI